MQKIDVPLDGEYQSDTLAISNQQAVNCHINIPQTNSFAAITLLGAAGIDQIASTGRVKQVNRGSHVKAGRFYFINGTTLYRLDQGVDTIGAELFTPVPLGSVPGTKRCSFADNGTQLIVVAPESGNGWVVNEAAGTAFQSITDTDFKANGNPQQVVFIDSFFVVTTDSKKFIKSAANDGLNWDPLEFGSAEADPDNIVTAIVNRNRLFVAGSETIEEFQNAGLGGFPFQRTGLVIPKGAYSPFGMVSIGDSFMWIGGGTNESPAIWQLSGNGAQKVSTTAIDSELQDFSAADLQDAFAFSFAQKGAFFIAFSFPSVTFVYDIVTAKWHERRSRITNDKGVQEDIRWRVNSLATAYNRIICCDSQDGRVGVINPDSYMEYDQLMLREFSTFTLYNNGNSFSIPFAELTMESGVGNDVEPDPQIRLRTSPDAKRFNESIAKSVGKVGEFGARQIWRKLGRFARMSVIKWEFSAPCKFSVLKVVLGVTNGR